MAVEKTTEVRDTSIPSPDAAGLVDKKADATSKTVAHPSGKESHGRAMQVLRGFLFGVYFTGCILIIFTTQLIGLPLYVINREWYYSYMAMTKQSFALTTNTMTYIWGPTKVRISGDESVAGQIRPTADGGVEFRFPERLVLIANHQIYSDWIYLWWVAYANRPSMHGHIYIILKESLKYIPIVGWGMMLYSFIFMSRKMATDGPRLQYRLRKLRKAKTSPDGKSYFDPMWLLLFPEGTNLSGNGRRKSAAWAAKNNLKDPEHMMLPRSTGTFFCLNELKGTVEYVYDCTVAYEGIPRGKYGEELFTLTGMYFEGRPPKSVNFYWRRFRVADLPLDNQEKFDLWLRNEWYKKDALVEEYMTTGRFPPLPSSSSSDEGSSNVDYVHTEVRTRHVWEILQIFVVLGVCGLVWNNIRKALQVLTGSADGVRLDAAAKATARLRS